VTEIQQILDELVPAADEGFGDWDEVLARAGVRRSRRLAVAAVVIVAAVAIPTLVVAAVLARTDVIFTRSKPAPNIVQKQFADLSLGAPPRFAVGVQAAKAREIGAFTVRGRRSHVWVAPAKGGGFCVMFERGFGGCTPRGPRRRILSATLSGGGRDGQWIGEVGGWIATRAPKAQIEIEYADGSHDRVPYIYVSPPISAGFFWFDVPKGHDTPKTRLVDVAVVDGTGRRLTHERFQYARTQPRVHVAKGPPRRYVPRELPARPDVPPSPPLQRGTGNGVTVTAGANGVVVFDLHRIDPTRRALLANPRARIGWVCFKLVREFGIFDDRGLGFEGALAQSVAVRIFGLPHPWDGCEIQGSYGHLWPDRNASHSAVEIPLTEKGRRYFADRAVARDLALFVRTAKIQRIRKLTGARLVAGLSRYPVVRLDSAGSSPPHGKIGYAPTPHGVVFLERSASGRRFVVEVRDRRIVSQNLKPYAFVF
jgi:hypothetical protein